MKPYVPKNQLSNLEKKSDLGLVQTLQDIEEIDIPAFFPKQELSTNLSQRVHLEESALCQSGGLTWHSRKRFVWGMNSDKDKALLMGYIEDHQGKNTEAYKALKGKANEVKDTDFKEEDHISSSEIVQQMVEQAAKKLTKKTKNISRLENLERTFRQMDPSQVSQSDLNNFIDTVKENLQENHLTNSEKKKIKKLPLNDPFRSLITRLDAASGSQGLQNAAQVLNNMGNQLTPQLQNVKNAQKSL